MIDGDYAEIVKAIMSFCGPKGARFLLVLCRGGGVPMPMSMPVPIVMT
jgi:hypothetical protein